MITIQKRVEMLEQSNRRLKTVLSLVAFVFVCGMVLAWQQKENFFEAGHYILKEGSKVKADFCITNSPHKSPGIWFFNDNENPRLFIGLNNDDNPVVYFLDEEGKIADSIGLVSSVSSGKVGLKKINPRWPADMYKKYYVENTRTSRSFHRKNCSMLEGKTLRELSLKLAKERGMLPCKKCCPDLWPGLSD